MSEVKKMNLVRIPIGDEGGDGHQMYKDFFFNIPAEFSKEILLENYKKNKESFGFGLSDFANEYEENFILEEQLEKLFKKGFTFSQKAEGSMNDKTDGKLSLSKRSFIEITLFFVGCGLNGFYAEIVENKPDFDLFSHYKEGDFNIGYGLYSF